MRIRAGVFLVLCLIGIASASLAYRYLQTDPLAPLATRDRSRVALDDTDKKLLDARDATSKWLLGLAFSLLPGTLIGKRIPGLQTQDNSDEPVLRQSLLPLVAAAFLVTSLYGFFLSQQSVIFVLTHGPQYHLYGTFSEFPILVQFWTLLGGLVVLLFHLMRPSTRMQFPKLVLLFGVLAAFPPEPAQAATPEATCAAQWSESRSVKLSSEQVNTAASVVRAVANRATHERQATCTFANSVLDGIRWSAYKSGGADKDFDEVLTSTSKELAGAGFSPGGTVDQLLEAARLWVEPSGLLRVTGSPSGATILLNGRTIGLSDLDVRLKPGTYLVEVLRGGSVVYRDASIVITIGQATPVAFK